MPATIAHVRALNAQGAILYCWSSGGADYAQHSAEEVGIADCFTAFLPKPHVLIDDQQVTAWRRLRHVHPTNCRSTTVEEYWQHLFRPHATKPS